MASQDEETKRMMRTLIEQQAEMIKLMRLTTNVSQPTPPNPSSIPRPAFLPPPQPTSRLPSQPTFRPPTPSTYHHQPPPVPHPRPSQPNQPRHNPKARQPRPVKARFFNDLWKPVSEILSEFTNKGLLKPLHPRPLPSPLPPHFNPSQYCAYHQNVGHPTNNCRRLQHAIQDLIDGGVVTPPKEHANPTSAAIPQPPTPSAAYAQGGECSNSTKKRKRYQG